MNEASVLSTVVDPLHAIKSAVRRGKGSVRQNVDHYLCLATVVKRLLCIYRCLGMLTRKCNRFMQIGHNAGCLRRLKGALCNFQLTDAAI